MSTLDEVAQDIMRQLSEYSEPAHREESTEMPYRGDIPTKESVPIQEPQPAYYVVRARMYETRTYGTNVTKTLDLKHEKFERLEDAQAHLEHLVRGKFANNEHCLLLYGFLAEPNVEVKHETITHVNTSYKPV